MSFTQSLLHSICNNTGSPQDVKSSWHLASSSGNQISDSFKSIILCTGRSSIRSPSFWVFPINNLTLWTKPPASEFMPTTFAIGHWLWLASVFSKTISPFWKFLCFSFHSWWGWSDHRNSFRYLTQNSLAVCCYVSIFFYCIHQSSQNDQVVAKLPWTSWWECCLCILVVRSARLPTYRQRPRIFSCFCLCQTCPQWFIV